MAPPAAPAAAAAAAIFFRPKVPSSFSTFLIVLLFFSVSPAKAGELQILLDFKSALAKSNTTAFRSWDPQASYPCNFTGIVCNSGGVVTEIDLPSNQLLGSVPFDSICAGLPSLEKISLGSNHLYGRITDGLKNCTRLRSLDLGGTSISGTVPDLSPLKGLEYLNLNGSAFSGKFPWESLQKLVNLSFLSIGDNPFDKMPVPTQIPKMENLYWLYLTNCSLVGRIPEDIGNLVKLQNLELSDNFLYGEIPAGITKLRNLWQLELYNNSLTGKLPAGFRNLTSLVNFDASQNRLEGDLSELRFSTELASLQLFENRFSGEIPQEFGDFKKLQQLSLYDNKLTGTLPRKLGSWSDFRYIDVSDNLLTGPIPPDMCKKNVMIDLLLLNNSFTGEVPASYAECTSLARLRVTRNSLSGPFPAGIWSLPNLRIIDLAFNQFEGGIPPGIANARSLAQIYLSNNRFSGELPEAISRASSLALLALSWNRFTGGLPASIGQLKNLYSLQLQGNMFSGALPESLGFCVSLSDINLAGNSLSGPIPATLGALPALNSLNLSNNSLSGEIPKPLSSLKLSLLDLSNNRLTGQVPDSLSAEAYSGSFNGNPGLCSDRNNRPSFKPCSSFDPSKPSHLKIVISCLVAGTAVLLVSLACLLLAKLRRRHSETISSSRAFSEEGSWDMKRFHVLTFSEQEIIKAIKHENLIRKGGSGNVYKVSLKNGNVLAVKHIWKSYSADQASSKPMLPSKRGRLPEYDAEVAALSSIRHVNVVKLYCSISSEDSNLLVYEYMPNGSLWDRMHTCQKIELGWDARYYIALGAARGLEYLHHGCDRPVIHRDVKSSNILLDEELKPRIADFGLAKIVHANTYTMDSSQTIAGTHGYIAPEYGYTYKVNKRSDVYSFGVVLMELVTGKRPLEPEFGENKNIVSWVCNKVRSKEGLFDAVDASISESQKDDALKVLKIAVQCAANLPALRPSMRMVVQMLEEAEPCRLTSIVVKKEIL